MKLFNQLLFKVGYFCNRTISASVTSSYGTSAVHGTDDISERCIVLLIFNHFVLNGLPLYERYMYDECQTLTFKQKFDCLFV